MNDYSPPEKFAAEKNNKDKEHVKKYMCAFLRETKMHQTNITNDRRFVEYNPRGRRIQSFNNKCYWNTPSPLLQVSSRRVSAVPSSSQCTRARDYLWVNFHEPDQRILLLILGDAILYHGRNGIPTVVTDLPNTGINSDAISATRSRCCEVTVLLN